ncbi:MAG: hypothetical protein ABJH98_08625 [Reichenbachiella sp.]|uniref:hypothetical protein n=1 Tax=Reichenbachiella sp. TaxID=2184521 RepID=UPI00329A0049
MPDFKEKKEKYEVIKHKTDSLVMAVRDMSDEDIRKFSVKNLHDVDKHIFEILKIIERY